MLTQKHSETSSYAAYLDRLVAQVLREAASEVVLTARWFPDTNARLRLKVYARNILEVATDLETVSSHEAAFSRAVRRSATFLTQPPLIARKERAVVEP